MRAITDKKRQIDKATGRETESQRVKDRDKYRERQIEQQTDREIEGDR